MEQNKTPNAQARYLILLLGIFSPILLLAQFQGDYAPENWTFTSQDLTGTPADGYIDLSNMPTGFTMAGNDDELLNANSLYSITIPETGIIKFRWTYRTEDGPDVDIAGYRLNEIFVKLTDSEGDNDQSGEIELPVIEGDEFAFVVDGTDGIFGRGWLTIDAFSTADNTPPTIDSIVDVIINMNSGQIDIDLKGITAGILEPSQKITMIATSSNTAVIPNPNITYNSPDETGELSFTPVADAFGDVIITVNVMDDGGTSNGSIDNIDVIFSVSIASNLPPEIDAIGDIEKQINEPFSIPLTGISAGTGEMQTISVAASSSNQSVIADGDISVTYSSPDATGTLNITPVANASGEAAITVTVSDNGGTANNGMDETTISFIVTIAPNGQPRIIPVSDLSLFVNAVEQNVNVAGIRDGDSDVDQTISLTATSDNPALIPNPTVTYSSPNATGTLTFTPLADQSGTATITVTVGDNAGTSNGGINETTFTFEVSVSGNYAPEIDAIGNIVMGINEPTRIVNLSGINAGIVSGVEVVFIMATSSNADIIDAGGILVNYTDPDATGTLDLTPITDATGETVITVTVSDDAGTANGGVNEVTETFIVKVVSNNTPSIDQVDNLGLDINAPEQIINLSGITSGEASEYQTISILATSDNTALIPDPTVTYSSPNATGTLTFTPVTNALGSANITVTVLDDGGTLGGSSNSSTMSFQVSVIGNQPPTLDVIDDINLTSTEAFNVTISGISDGTGFAQNLVVTATSDNPTIIPDPAVNYLNGQDAGTLNFVPTDFGDAIITVTITDDGGTDNGGVDTYIQMFSIHIGENTPPDIIDWDSGDPLDGETFYLNNGQGDKAIFFSVEDSENHAITSVTITGNSNPELSDILTLNYTLGSFLGGLIFDPISGQTGTTDIEISVRDDGGTANNGIDTRVITMTVVVTEPTTYQSQFASGNDTQYHVQPFTVDESGLAFFESLDNSYDDEEVSYQLYETSFNELNQAENRLAQGRSMTFDLVKDRQYILVTFNRHNGDGNATTAIGLISGSVSFGFLPNLDFVENITMDEDGSLVVPLAGISDGSGGTGSLILSAAGNIIDAFDSFDIVNNYDGTGSVQLNPANDVNGIFQVTVTVIGVNGNTFDRAFEVTINPINDAPELASGNQAVDEETELSFTANATDVDSNSLTFELDATSLANGMTIDASTGDFSWTPDETEDGIYSVTITASDGSLEGSETITVTVNEVNLAPMLGTLGNQMIAEKSALSFTATAADADLPANTLVFRLDATSISKGMTINASTGTFSWTPTFEQAGTYSVEVSVSDGSLSDSEIIQIVVDDVLGLSLENKIEVYPNPAMNYLKINSTEIGSIRIFDLNGAKVMETKMSERINVSNLKSGTYLLQLIDNSGSILSTNSILKQ